jgi:hypothetical protein
MNGRKISTFVDDKICFRLALLRAEDDKVARPGRPQNLLHRRRSMKNKRSMIAFVVCVLVAAVAAFATPGPQLARHTTPITVTGPCCQNIADESVKITEPATLAPVILTWSMEYVSTGPFAVGVSINGGGCGDYGPEYLPQKTAVTGIPFFPTAIQWIIVPQDGLHSGPNTFQVCEGPTVNNNDQLTLGTRTLSVQISK